MIERKKNCQNMHNVMTINTKNKNEKLYNILHIENMNSGHMRRQKTEDGRFLPQSSLAYRRYIYL